MKIIILGITGMLGSTMYKVLSNNSNYKVYGTCRLESAKTLFPDDIRGSIISGIDVRDLECLTNMIVDLKPNVIINCVGIVKQSSDAKDLLTIIPINTLFPHQLFKISKLIDARLIHISTDCVFSGIQGNYIESDAADAKDLYGVSKYLGEVSHPNALTLRTSIIGHELGTTLGIVEWFLSQEKSVKGYKRAFFSGLTTLELSLVIQNILLKRHDIFGLYHVSSESISKFNLLQLLKTTYTKSILIEDDYSVNLDRSLNSSKFNKETGYTSPQWSELINNMYLFQHSSL